MGPVASCSLWLSKRRLHHPPDKRPDEDAEQVKLRHRYSRNGLEQIDVRQVSKGRGLDYSPVVDRIATNVLFRGWGLRARR